MKIFGIRIGHQVKVKVMGATAEEAHALFHQWDIEHHAFDNNNGFNFVDAGEFGLIARGSYDVEIPLHGRAAENPEEVAEQLRRTNSNWIVRVLR